MFLLKTLYCRIFQAGFRLVLPILPYREPKILAQIDQLKNVLKKESITSLLIVTDKGIVSNGLLTPILSVLHKTRINYHIYDNTQANPTVTNVEEAKKLYLKKNCQAILAVGGGSPMDCAKAVGAGIAYPHKKMEDLKGILRVLRPIPPLIAIPTTAGTGSEVTLAAVITDSLKMDKYAIISFPLIPRYAVLDAKMTYSLPAHITAATGMDALTHAIEAYIGRSTTKETRALSLNAIKLIFENIETAFHNGQNHNARENMLRASYMAGHAFSKSYVGYIHAIAHSLGGTYGIPHGLANAVIMPYVLKGYGKSIHKKLHQIAVFIGLCNEYEPPRIAAKKLIRIIELLNARMNIPNKISGINRNDISNLAAHAEKEANPLYPVPKLMTGSELEKFYYQIADWSK